MEDIFNEQLNRNFLADTLGPSGPTAPHLLKLIVKHASLVSNRFTLLQQKSQFSKVLLLFSFS